MIIKNELDIGFAENAGSSNRTIIRIEDLFYIGCFKGSYKEAFEAISKKYKEVELKKYIAKLDESKLDIDDELLINYNSGDVALKIVKYSDLYHHIFKDNSSWQVRLVVAKYSELYHDQFKDDVHWRIRAKVAEYSTTYHKHLKDDPHKLVRYVVDDYKNKRNYKWN